MKIICWLLVAAVGLLAQDVAELKARYEKHEVRIPMRDGVKLFAAVYAPRDTSHDHPILLSRTPYGVGPYGPDAYRRPLGPSPKFEEAGYIFVYQDVRGKFMSEGTFIQMTPQQNAINESTDTYDTIDWLVKHIEHNNGKVGLWGISYDGFFAAAGAINAHPALKAVSPQAPQADWFTGDDTHHNGAFFLAATFNFMAGNGRTRAEPGVTRIAPFAFGTPDGYRFFLNLGPLSNADARYFHGQVPGWTEMMEHANFDDFWRARNLLPHLVDIRPAILTVGGLYDANNFYGALHVFEAIEAQSKATSNTLVIGPWYHGQWARDDGESLGGLQFGSKTAVLFRDEIQFPFFEYHLNGKGTFKLPKAQVFETGVNRWRTFDNWPPKDTAAKAIFLRESGTLSFQPPAGNGFDEYVSDVMHPVPFIPILATGMSYDYMAHDQRFAATRPDVLVYQTAPLTEDLTIAGPVTPSLFVSTTGTDSDWVVKVIDVHPDSEPPVYVACLPQRISQSLCGTIPKAGFQELVRGDVLRGKFRNSLTKPEPFVPGKVTQVEFATPDVLHTFQKGHRVMVQIQSSWFPLVDRNPQKFVDIYGAKEQDFESAKQRVYRSARQSSKILVNVLAGSASGR